MTDNADLGGNILAFGGFIGDSFTYSDSNITFDNVCYFNRALGENNVKALYKEYAE